MSVTDKTRLCYLLPLFVNLILLLSEWHCAMLILELGDLCVVKAEPGNRPHSGMRNDEKQTLRERARRGGRQGAYPVSYFYRGFLISLISSLPSFLFRF